MLRHAARTFIRKRKKLRHRLEKALLKADISTSHHHIAGSLRNRRHRRRRVGVSAINTAGLDIGITTGSALAWAGGSGRTFALRPVSLEGSVALGVSGERYDQTPGPRRRRNADRSSRRIR
jgi:hypothetical protein